MMSGYQQYLQATRHLLQLNAKAGTHRVKICGREFLASPRVFSPRFFADTEIFAQHLPVISGEDFLEIGCGIGAIGIIAALKGAKKVVITDINRHAVHIAHRNVNRHKLKYMVDVRQGNVFQPIRDDEKFDTIFCNVPFGLVAENRRLSMLARAVFDPSYRFLRQFITGGPRYLKPGGRLIIGFSSTLGKLALLMRFCHLADMRLRLLHRQKSKEIYPVSFELFEARK